MHSSGKKFNFSSEGKLSPVNQNRSKIQVLAFTAANEGFNPSEIMNVRWLQAIQPAIPSMDFDDLNIYDNPDIKPRQFAPEFSHQAYQVMLARDVVIGDYINNLSQFRVTRAGFSTNKFSCNAA